MLRTNGEFVITSESLKKLVIEDLYIPDLVISCPILEELELLHRSAIKTVKIVNLQSLIYVNLDFDDKYQIKEILPQLQHVKELKLGRDFMRTALHPKGEEGTDLSTLSLSKKCLILDCPSSGEIALALRNFYATEKLVITFPGRKYQKFG